MKAKKRPLLKSKEVAQLLDMSPDDIITMARSGKLKGRKEEKFWKFKWTDITEYRRKLARTVAA